MREIESGNIDENIARQKKKKKRTRAAGRREGEGRVRFTSIEVRATQQVLQMHVALWLLQPQSGHRVCLSQQRASGTCTAAH